MNVDPANDKDPKRVVKTFLEEFGDARFRLLADDALWHVMGSTAVSGTFSKAYMCEAIGGFIRDFAAGPFQMTPVGMIAEGGCIAAEVRSFVSLKDGSTYENSYHNKYAVRDGSVIEITEYMDTGYFDKLFGPAPKV